MSQYSQGYKRFRAEVVEGIRSDVKSSDESKDVPEASPEKTKWRTNMATAVEKRIRKAWKDADQSKYEIVDEELSPRDLGDKSEAISAYIKLRRAKLLKEVRAERGELKYEEARRKAEAMARQEFKDLDVHI